MSEQHDELTVTEYLTAAALRAAGARLLRVEPGDRCGMVFDDTARSASAMLQRHRDGKLRISSRDMADAIQAVKNEIFAARRVGGPKLLP